MLDRREAKEIAQYVLKELKKSSYAYATDGRFDYRKTGIGRAKGGTIGQIGPEYQHYVCDVEWISTGEDTIEWSAGTLTLADGRSQALDLGGVTLVGTGLNYFWAVIGNSTIQTSTNYYDGVGDDKALLAFATKAPENDQLALVYPFFGTEPTFNSDVLSANMILAAHIKAGVITASHIQVGSISADRLDFVAFEIGYNDLDDVGDGSTYGRILSTDISAGHILLSAAQGNLDDIADGVTNGKVLLTDLSSGHLKLTSNTVKDGEWYDESGVEIDASNGINIYGTNNALTTRATKAGTIQCSVNSSGEITAGAGNVVLNSSGLTIYGQYLTFYYSGVLGLIFQNASGLNLSSSSGGVNIFAGSDDIYLSAPDDIKLDAGGEIACYTDVRPLSTSYILGTESYCWGTVWAKNILTSDTNSGLIGDATDFYEIIYVGAVLAQRAGCFCIDRDSLAYYVGYGGIGTTGGELYAMDSFGNATKISPHDPITGEYIFLSYNATTGRKVRINMEQLVREVERLSGKTFMEDSIEDVSNIIKKSVMAHEK
jgi:hypothetical protein